MLLEVCQALIFLLEKLFINVLVSNFFKTSNYKISFLLKISRQIRHKRFNWQKYCFKFLEINSINFENISPMPSMIFVDN